MVAVGFITITQSPPPHAVADVGLIAAPHCFTMLLLATPIVQPESGVADTLTLWREAHLPILQGNIGVSMQGDLNT